MRPTAEMGWHPCLAPCSRSLASSLCTRTRGHNTTMGDGKPPPPSLMLQSKLYWPPSSGALRQASRAAPPGGPAKGCTRAYYRCTENTASTSWSQNRTNIGPSLGDPCAIHDLHGHSVTRDLHADIVPSKHAQECLPGPRVAAATQPLASIHRPERQRAHKDLSLGDGQSHSRSRRECHECCPWCCPCSTALLTLMLAAIGGWWFFVAILLGEQRPLQMRRMSERFFQIRSHGIGGVAYSRIGGTDTAT